LLEVNKRLRHSLEFKCYVACVCNTYNGEGGKVQAMCEREHTLKRHR